MLIQNIYARLGSNIIQGGLSVIASIFIVRILGIDIVGQIAYYYGLVGMLTLFTDMGIGTAYMKFMASDNSHGQDIAGYLFLKLGFVALFCLIAWIAFHYFYKSPSLDKTLFFIAFLITLIEVLSQFFSATLSGIRNFILLSKIEIAGSIILFLYNLFVCLLYPSIYLLALNMAIQPLILIIAGAYHCVRYNVVTFEKPEKETLMKYFRYSYPLAFSSIVGLFTTHFEKVIIGRLIGIKELGFYRLALGIFSGFDRLIKPVTSTLFTELSYRVNRSFDFIKTAFRDLVQTINLIASLLALLLIFTSKPIISLFYGVENIRTAIILQFFALSIISRLFWRPYRHILFAVEAHHPLTYLSIFEFVLRLSLYYFLIPLKVKGIPLGAIAIPLTEFILWIIPTGIYNIIALLQRFESIHIRSVILRIWLPLGLLVFAAAFINFNLFLLPVFFCLFLALEYYLDIFTKERWQTLLSPLYEIVHHPKG